MSSGNKRTISVGLNYSDFKGGITECNRQMKLLEASFKLANEQMKRNASESEQLELKQSKLTQAILLQTQKISKMEEAYNKALEGGKKTTTQLDTMRTAIINQQTALERMRNELANTTEELEHVEDSSETATQGFSGIGEGAANMAGAVELARLALEKLKEAANAFIDFDTKMSKVATIADTSKVSLSKLKDGVYDIAKSTGKAADDIAEALYQCISANVKTTDALKVTKAAADLAKAGFTDTSVAVDALTTVMNAYGLSADYVTEISDRLIKTQKLGKTTVGEFGSALGSVAGIAAQAGVSFDEVCAAVATMTQVNGSADESVTSLKSALTNIIKPSAEAEKLAKKLHISFNAQSLSAKGLSGFLEMVKKATHGNVEQMATLFGNVRAVNGMMLLTGKGADSFAKSIDEINNSSGTTTKALDAMDGTGNRVKESIERLKTALVQIGDVLSPLMDVVAFVFDILTNIPTPIYIIAGALGVLALTIKNITVLKTAWATATTLASATMGLLGGTAEITTASLAKFLLVIAAIVAVIGLIVGGIKSVKNAIKESQQATQELANSASRVQETMKTSANSSNNTIRHNAAGTQNFQGGRTWVGEAGPEIVELPSGSRIYSNEESQRMTGETINNYNIAIEARSIQEFNDIVRIVQGRQQATRRGIALE